MKTFFILVAATTFHLAIGHPKLRAEEADSTRSDFAVPPTVAATRRVADEVGSVKILGASYSFGSDFADVTARVRELVRGGETFQANPGWLQADPHPYWNKALVVFCEVRGQRAIFSTGENGDVSRDLILQHARPVPPPPVLNRPWTLLNMDGCTLTQSPGGTVLKVPGTLHSLYFEDGTNNEPAVLTPMEGNFMVQVKVGGNFNPGTQPAPDMRRHSAFQGAGLEIYQDKDNYILFQRAEVYEQNTGRHLNWSPFLQQSLGGKFDGFIGGHYPTEEKRFTRDTTDLRLVRRGQRMEAYFSDDDGQTWQEAGQFAALPGKSVLVGVGVGTTSAQEFTVTFNGLTITPLTDDAE